MTAFGHFVEIDLLFELGVPDRREHAVARTVEAGMEARPGFLIFQAGVHARKR